MSRRIPLLALVLAPFAAGGQTPPKFVKIEESGGKLFAAMTVTRTQMIPETITVNVNGKLETRTVNRTVTVQSLENKPLTAEAGDYFTPGGERIDAKKLADVLRKGAVVAIAADGKPLDKELLKKHADLVAILVPKGSIATAEPKKELGDEPPFATDVTLKDGAITIQRFSVVYNEVPRKETRKMANGKVDTVTAKARVPVTQQQTITLDPKRTQVLRFDGTEVPAADWGRVIGDKAKVIVSPGGKVVPDELRNTNKDAVAVVVFKLAK